MKKVLSAFALVFIWVMMVPAGALGGDVAPPFSGHEKVGPILKSEWFSAMEKGDLSKKVACLVTLETADKKCLRRLKKAGFKKKSVLKTVVTGELKIGDLPSIAGLDVVRAIELSKKLSLK